MKSIGVDLGTARPPASDDARASAVWTPIQQRVGDELLGLGRERPLVDLSWAGDLAHLIDQSLDGKVAHSPADPLWLSKATVSGVLACEAHHVALAVTFAGLVGPLGERSFTVPLPWRQPARSPKLRTWLALRSTRPNATAAAPSARGCGACPGSARHSHLGAAWDRRVPDELASPGCPMVPCARVSRLRHRRGWTQCCG